MLVFELSLSYFSITNSNDMLLLLHYTICNFIVTLYFLLFYFWANPVFPQIYSLI